MDILAESLRDFGLTEIRCLAASLFREVVFLRTESKSTSSIPSVILTYQWIRTRTQVTNSTLVTMSTLTQRIQPQSYFIVIISDKWENILKKAHSSIFNQTTILLPVHFQPRNCAL